MHEVCGLKHNPDGFADTFCGVNVYNVSKRYADDLHYCPQYPLQDLVIWDGAIPKPDSDAEAQDAFASSFVECVENGRSEGYSFSQSSEKGETQLGFLGNGAGVEGPKEMFWQVNTKECTTLDDFHERNVDVQYGVIPPGPPEVNINFLKCVHILRFRGCWR